MFLLLNTNINMEIVYLYQNMWEAGRTADIDRGQVDLFAKRHNTTTYFPKCVPLLMLLNSSSSELESDSESGGSVRRSRWPEPFLVFFLLLSPSPIKALSSFLFFIFFWGVSEPAGPDLNPTKSKVLSSLVTWDNLSSSSAELMLSLALVTQGD